MLAPISGTRKDGRSSFRALKDYLAQEFDAETGEIRPRGVIVLSANLRTGAAIVVFGFAIGRFYR
jgi:hypothetical protein